MLDDTKRQVHKHNFYNIMALSRYVYNRSLFVIQFTSLLFVAIEIPGYVTTLNSSK